MIQLLIIFMRKVMKKQVQVIAGFIIAIAFLVTSFGSTSKLEAQPTGYCIPGESHPQNGDYSSTTCYQSDDYIYYKYMYNPHIKSVKIFNESETPVHWSGPQPYDEMGVGCYLFDDQNYVGDGLVFPGNTYTVQMTVKYRYYWYYTNPTPYCNAYYYYPNSNYNPSVWAMHRVFMDWGMDGSFFEKGSGSIPADFINNGDKNSDGQMDYILHW